ncbi:MAG TPA: TIM barrel protein [Acidobacteriota bacterium]|jgi:inosose dehydratase
MNRRDFLKTGAAAAIATRFVTAAPRRAKFQIGITTNTRGGWESDLIKSFREASEVGYHAVETFYNYVRPYWDRPGELKEILSQLNLRLETVSNGGPMIMQFEDAAAARQVIDEHLQLVRWIKGFGCDHLKINTGRRRPEGTTQEDLQQMARTMNALGKTISAEGLKFGVHAHLWTQFQDRSEIDRLMELTDAAHVFLVVDTGQVTMAGIDPVDLTRRYADRIIEFHLKDCRPEDRGGHKGPIPKREGYTDKGKRIFYELGTGGVDFPGILTILKKHNWNGWLTVELDSSDTTPRESAAQSKQYLEKVLKLQV